MISAQEIEVIKSTAPLLATHGKDITGRFYQLLFEQNPELSNVFNMSNQRSGNQQQALARAVYAFAAHVDNLPAIAGEVERIAQKHASLGVIAEQYPLVGAALLQAIEQTLQPPAEVLDAWAKGYGVLAGVFIEREAQIYQQKAAQPGGWRDTRTFNIVKKETESELVTSFYLQPADGEALAAFEPGQYIAVYLTPEGSQQRHIRQYSLSDSNSRNHYRISVKRESDEVADGVVSNYLHDRLDVGDSVQLSNPFGDFYLQNSGKPLVLISGGVGITPMQSMLETLLEQNSKCDIHFVHATSRGSHHSFARRLQELAAAQKVSPHVFYEHPEENDHLGEGYHYQGRIDLDAIEAALPIGEAEFYLCGPLAMMKDVYLQLKMLHVADEVIFYEVFGPTKSLAD
ncbi:NO-inducible flavohemoprotein [Nitrococcus mobilis]|uniref:Flavohemoprotein n=1 Tax=Nitrococcus mobilis Nb-231 TaxID=314278 RepID=A4BR57_9GAMM|nr:NO-inducible flavohemoprotein [Nitrococcus mobilis]EAR21679.1 Nitric oxide dioxygenase [Nitrococcus mobilis Nb-231]